MLIDVRSLNTENGGEKRAISPLGFGAVILLSRHARRTK